MISFKTRFCANAIFERMDNSSRAALVVTKDDPVGRGKQDRRESRIQNCEDAGLWKTANLCRCTYLTGIKLLAKGRRRFRVVVTGRLAASG